MNKLAHELLMQSAPWKRAFSIQQRVTEDFHQACTDLLRGSCPLQPLDPSLLTLKRNLFSTLFIMATEAAGVAVGKLPFYAMINQCLRVQVTGCDNLLDDEYKSVIPFDLSGSGTRFRSVLTVMTGDAVLARLIMTEVAAGRMDQASAQQLQAAALAVLIPSGLEEHEEESQFGEAIPTVEMILQNVHPRKTGMLFEAPIRLVQKMGDVDPDRAAIVAEAVANFGIGCQIIDDLKDVADDLFLRKYNLVISEALHGGDRQEKQKVDIFSQPEISIEAAQKIATELPLARSRCLDLAREYFQRAEKSFTQHFPDFGAPQAGALGLLVKESIMADSNDQQDRDAP